MRDKVFLDSNLLVYTASSDVLKKQTVQFLLQKDFDFGWGRLLIFFSLFLEVKGLELVV